MGASELKLDILKEIDSLNEKQLTEFYGILKNFINNSRELSDWKELSDYQRNGILDAVGEIEAGEGIPHSEVIAKHRKKYSNG